MLYLKLFHGRTDPKQEMDNWGSNGPVFGPLHYVHTTYASCIKIENLNGSSGMLSLFDDMIYYNGIFYGDWSVFGEKAFRKGNTKLLVLNNLRQLFQLHRKRL